MTKNIWAIIGFSALSGILIALSMPGFNFWFLGWIALVPLLVILFLNSRKNGCLFLRFHLELFFQSLFIVGIQQ